MSDDALTLSARWHSVAPPRKITGALSPFGMFKSRGDWRGIAVTAYDAFEIDANGVDLTGATFEGATISLNLVDSLLADVTFTDCELTAARFDDCSSSTVKFLNCSLNHSKLRNCRVSDLVLDRGTADSLRLSDCHVDRFTVVGGSAEKMRFEMSDVLVILATSGQGNLTFLDCKGLAVFGSKAIPHRLFNKSSNMVYYVASDATTLAKAARVGNWCGSDVIANGAGLTRLAVGSGNIVMLRDLIARGGVHG